MGISGSKVPALEILRLVDKEAAGNGGEPAPTSAEVLPADVGLGNALAALGVDAEGISAAGESG